MDFPLQLPGPSGLPVPGVVIRILCNHLGHLVCQFLAWRGVGCEPLYTIDWT